MVTIEGMIEANKDRLYRLCLHLEQRQDRAEELFQDTWVKAIEKWHTYDQSYAFYPWLTQIAVNTYRDKLRQFKRELQHYRQLDTEEMQEIEDQQVSVEEAVYQKVVLDAVRKAIQSLPDKYKLPLILVCAEKMSYQEAASVLGIDEKRLKSRVYDGRQRLKNYLIKEGYDER